MTKYIVKRVLRSLITMFIIITILFALLRMMPIEGYFENFDKLTPAVINARMEAMGLNDPIPVQLKDFFVQLFHGDLGTSARYRVGAPILDIIAQKAPVSAAIGATSMGLALLLGILLCAVLFILCALLTPRKCKLRFFWGVPMAAAGAAVIDVEKYTIQL